jgi:hypothetical protein
MKKTYIIAFVSIFFGTNLLSQTAGIVAIGYAKSQEPGCHLIDCSTGYFCLIYKDDLPVNSKQIVTDSLLNKYPRSKPNPSTYTFGPNEVAIIYEAVQNMDAIETGCQKTFYGFVKGKTLEEAKANLAKKKSSIENLIKFNEVKTLGIDRVINSQNTKSPKLNATGKKTASVNYDGVEVNYTILDANHNETVAIATGKNTLKNMKAILTFEYDGIEQEKIILEPNGSFNQKIKKLVFKVTIEYKIFSESDKPTNYIELIKKKLTDQLNLNDGTIQMLYDYTCMCIRG